MTVDAFDENSRAYKRGTIIPWTDGVAAIPPGWAACDGANGTPDMRGRIPKATVADSVSSGGTGGQDTVTLTSAEVPSHAHSVTSTGTAGDHSHGWWKGGSSAYGGTGAHIPGTNTPQTYDTNTTGAHSHTFTTGETGGGSGIDNRPAYVSVHFIMRL